MTREEVVRAINELPVAERDRLATDLATGYILGAHQAGDLADTIGSMIGVLGIALVTVDDHGARLRDAWNNEGPRGAQVEHVMNLVHGAISRVLEGEMGLPRTDRSS